MKHGKPLIGVVDHKPEVCQSIGSLLRSAGYQSIVFESPEAFLTSPSRRQTNCLIVNFQTPGLHVLELRRLLSAVDRATPVIGIYAVEEHLRSKALEYGAFEVFGEPFRIPMVTIEPRDGEAATNAFSQAAGSVSGKPFSDVALLSAIQSALRSSRQDPDDLE